MEWIDTKWNDFRVLQVDTWNNEGVLHGFIGEDINLQDGGEDFFKDRTGLEVKRLKQVHGNKLKFSPYSEQDDLEADAWLADICSARPVEVLGISTADCVPVILKDSDRVSIIHAGWKSAAQNIVKLCLEHFEPAQTEVAIGPHAMSCCYEFGPELIDEFGANSKKFFIEKNGKLYLSLQDFIAEQLIDGGVEKNNILSSKWCTICSPGFHSFRRDKQNSGRQLSFISPCK